MISLFIINKCTIGINLALRILYLILTMITYEPLIEGIVMMLLSPYIDKKIEKLLNNPVKTPTSFNSVWQPKNLWDSVEEVLNKRGLSIYDNHRRAFKRVKSENEIEEVSMSPQQREELLKDVYTSDLVLKDAKDSVVIEEEHIELSRGLGIITDEAVSKATTSYLESPLDLLAFFKKVLVNC